MTKLGWLKYLFVFAAGVGAANVVSSMLTGKKLSKFASMLLLGVAAAASMAAYATMIEPNWIQVNRVAIHDTGLAQSLEGVRLVQISDIHLTQGLGGREKQLVKKVNALNPDFLFITGDFLDSRSQLPYITALLSQFKTKHGIWGVPGNTDHLTMDGRQLGVELGKAGVHILVNESKRMQIEVGKYFWLVGVDDPVEHHADLAKALTDVPPGSPVILLAHSPDIFEKAAQRKINLLLAGHTHGGQVGIPFLVRLSNYADRTPYMKGFYQIDSTKLFVNSGIGIKTLPVRFLCRPEITVIEVKP